MIGSLVLAAAFLLAGAGLAKAFAPDAAVTMLRSGWPALRRVPRLGVAVRAGGVTEAAVGGAVASVGGAVPVALLGAGYLAFAVVTIRLVSRGQRSSCGCFGRADSPVGPAHLVLNVACVGIAVAGTIRPPGPLGSLADGPALPAVVGVAQAALLAYLGFLSITALPALTTARRVVLDAVAAK